MDIKSIQSRAPTRIDLAGGTVDIWPIYLFLQNPLTVNLGIDLFAEATLELSEHGSNSSESHGVTLRSVDQSADLNFSWKQIEQGVRSPPSLDLHFKLLEFFFEKRKKRGLNLPHHDLVLTTRARSPAGAGLGGSSSLTIAMIGALAAWAQQPSEGSPQPIDPHQSGETLISIARDIETTVIQVPAGLQDYYGAMYGGLQCLHWGTGSHQRTALPSHLIQGLEKRLLLFYSGQSRNSGINNWSLFKSFIDREDEVRSRFQKIVAATQKLKTALENQQWKSVGEAISEEWEIRKTLAPQVTTSAIDLAIKEANRLTPLSSKICGAGGGGCFFVYLPDDTLDDSGGIMEGTLKDSIKKIFVRHGMQPLDFHGVSQGLDVKITTYHSALPS